MEKEQKPTQETHPDESQLNSAGGDEAVSEAVTDAPDPLAVINQATGRDYKDLDTALESIKEMQKEASQKQNLAAELEAKKAEPQTDDELRETVAQLKKQLDQNSVDNFFASNPDHEANRELLEKIAKADGISVAKAIESTAYQAVFDAQKTAKASESKRTVASSNNRVAQPQSDDFNPADHAGDATALAEYVAKNYINK